MCGRPLKNFENYRDDIYALSLALGIKITYKRTGDDGVYRRSESIIYLDPDLAESTEIALTLHELGHSQDSDLQDASALAYPDFYRRQATEAQKQAILYYEQRAWNIGRALAGMLRIPLGKWFDEEEKDCMDGYRNWKRRRYVP